MKQNKLLFYQHNQTIQNTRQRFQEAGFVTVCLLYSPKRFVKVQSQAYPKVATIAELPGNLQSQTFSTSTNAVCAEGVMCSNL